MPSAKPLVEVMRLEDDLKLQVSLAQSYSGTFIWKIPDIAQRKKDAVEERLTSICSPPFYTGRLVHYN